MTDFTGEYDAGWVNHQYRQYVKLSKNLKAIDEKKRQEKAEIDAYYAHEQKLAEEQKEQISEDMARYLDQYGMTSVSTSQCNIHIRRKGDKLLWKDLNAAETREVGNQLPDNLVNRVPKKGDLLKAVVIQNDGTVVLKETGEILKGLQGQLGGQKTVVFKKG